MGFALFIQRLNEMRSIIAIIILNLLLIPLFWLLPNGHRIHVYTVMAVVDGISYLILTACFFIRLLRTGKDALPGMTLRFLLLQFLLLFSFFLCKLSGFLLLKHCI